MHFSLLWVAFCASICYVSRCLLDGCAGAAADAAWIGDTPPPGYDIAGGSLDDDDTVRAVTVGVRWILEVCARASLCARLLARALLWSIFLY
jgi:hypothetical protein